MTSIVRASEAGKGLLAASLGNLNPVYDKIRGPDFGCRRVVAGGSYRINYNLVIRSASMKKFRKNAALTIAARLRFRAREKQSSSGGT
jgi:hypothetical protein